MQVAHSRNRSSGASVHYTATRPAIHAIIAHASHALAECQSHAAPLQALQRLQVLVLAAGGHLRVIQQFNERDAAGDVADSVGST